ncbi:MAG: hypothetical protein ACRDD7_03755 [Peptostreptococcaceae bacterium]
MKFNKEIMMHMRTKSSHNKVCSEKELEYIYEYNHSDELFFAINKFTGDFYKGKRNQVAFSKINYLTSSISTNHGKDEKYIYDFYKLSVDNLTIEKYEIRGK